MENKSSNKGIDYYQMFRGVAANSLEKSKQGQFSLEGVILPDGTIETGTDSPYSLDSTPQDNNYGK